MAATPVSAPRFFWRDPASDKPLDGGKVYFYIAGTTTPMDVYADSAKASTLTNPVVLEADGGADIFLDGTYKIIVRRADETLVHEIDGVAGGGGGAGGGGSSSYEEIVYTVDHTLDITDGGKVVVANRPTTITFAIEPAGAMGNGYHVFIKNAGQGRLVLNPAGSETIDGLTTMTLASGESILLTCNGTLFRALMLGLGTSISASVIYTDSQNIGTADSGKFIIANKATPLTLSLAPAATLGSSWSAIFQNIGAGALTIDPNGAELIDGAATLVLATGQTVTVTCDGTAFYSSLPTPNTDVTTEVISAGTRRLRGVASALKPDEAVPLGQLQRLLGIVAVTSRLQLKRLDPTVNKIAFLNEGGRSGIFRFVAGNFTNRVGFDTLEGMTVKSDFAAASVGAWLRDYEEFCNVKWFGAKGDNATDDTAAIQAAVDFQDQNLWKADFSGTTPNLARFCPGYVLIPAGLFLINPLVGVRFWDKTDIRGAGVASTFVKPFNSSPGNLFYRFYNGTATGNGRVQHVNIEGIRGIVIGSNQIIFNLEHVGRGYVHHVEGGTQDRVDEFNNANQKYWPGSALFKIGVKDSTPNGYVNGSDVLRIEHFEAHFLEHAVLGASGVNMKQPEYIHLEHFEISDCHAPIVFNPSAGMIGYVGNGVMQRWGLDCIRADTSVAGADLYGIDSTSNKYKFENLYMEGESAFAGLIIRAGNQNIIDEKSMNRYGTTPTIYSNSGTATVIR